MKTFSCRIFLLACAVGVICVPRPIFSAPPAKGEEKVKQLDGAEHIGKVEMVDAYTIRISSDSGILNIPIALLGEKDFQKYGFQNGADRSDDGRLWHERKQALESEQLRQEQEGAANGEAKEGGKPKSAVDKNQIEISLSQISAFQPVIDLYEQTLASQKSENSASTSGPTSQDTSPDSASRPPQRQLFPSSPGPFSPGLGTPLQPAISAGTSAIQSATGVSGLPSAPSVPGH